MKKKTFIAILTLTLTAFIFTMLLTTCASTSKGSENMSEIILWNSGELNDRRINIKNENGQIVFPENGECYDLGWESKEMVIIYIPNGNYTLSHGSSYKEKFTTKGSVNISLNSNRARVHISGDISKTKVRVSKSAMPDVFGRINASALKAFKEINKSLKTTLPQTATIAIFPVTSNLIDRSELALESLTTHFVNAGYTVVEKRRLDELLAEYDFQRSGLVGEQTLGELLGADAVIFSNLDDNQNLRSIAVDVTKSTTLAKSMSDAKNIAQQYNMQIGQISGGTNNEAETINSFLASHNNILNTFKISNTGADIVVSGAMQQIGRKKKLLLTLHDPKNDIFRTDSLEYADALELWVKLQSIHGSSLYYMSSNLKSKYMKSDYATAHIKSQFGTGVNREEAEKFTQFFIFDAIS
ncbi:MAG: hypothetical protein FWD36_04855, partial [Treponema sp.]|nr:hypothetical protein [Treponema sp.]